MNTRRRLRGGLQLVELLVAGVITSVSLAAIVSMFVFAFSLTKSHDDKSVGYNIARLELEYIRSEGFSNAIVVKDINGVVTSKYQDGTRTTYYSPAGVALANSTGAGYSATLVVTSDKFDTVSGGALRPAADCSRTVIVTIRSLPSNTVVHTDGTILVRSGI